MHPADFAVILADLPPAPPVTTAFERRNYGASAAEGGAWYRSQREHMMGWFSELDGPGAYGRKTRGRTARQGYTNSMCPPALLWIGEALGEDPAVVERAAAACEAAGPTLPARCGAIRKIIPWSRIEELVTAHLERMTSIDPETVAFLEAGHCAQWSPGSAPPALQ